MKTEDLMDITPKLPKAYIDKQMKLNEFDLYVDGRVYVPTIETILLSEYACTLLTHFQTSNPFIIDVGTGSGILALILARANPKALIIATDISQDALDVAAINFERNLKDAKVNLIKTNLINGLSPLIVPDLIVANLPWGSNEFLLKSNTIEELISMPKVAIFREDGLMGAYIELALQVIEKKWNTTIICEIGVLPIEVVMEEMPKYINWEYVNLANGYSILRITT